MLSFLLKNLFNTNKSANWTTFYDILYIEEKVYGVSSSTINK